MHRIAVLTGLVVGLGACASADPEAVVETASPGWIEAIAKATEGRRVVQLGESGHGMAETYRLKTELVRHLHREHGFDLLLVEGGFAECWVASEQLAEWSPRDAMLACFWDTWASDEAEVLFEYVQAAGKTETPLRLAGFDNAPTSEAFLDWLEGRPELPAALLRAERSFQPILSGQLGDPEQLASHQAVAREGYREALDELELPMLRAIVEDRLASLAFDPEAFGRELFERLREPRMAANLLHHLQQNPDARVIVWAHNAHIAHAYSTFVGGIERQGEIVHRMLGDEVYTLGVYALGGRGFAWFMNDEYDLVAPPEGSLEQRLAERDGDPVFLDFATAPTPEFTWINEPTMALEWGLNPQEIVPRRMYDGVLLIREVSPITRSNASAETK